MTTIAAELAFDRASWNLRRQAVARLASRERELQAVIDNKVDEIREANDLIATLDAAIEARRELLGDLEDVLRLMSDGIPPEPEGPSRLRRAQAELFPR